MISPLVPYAIKGALWYQGESNAGRAFEYTRSFPFLIKDWRKQWANDLPFFWVQLPNYILQPGNIQKGSTWAELREAQAAALALPKTGMAVTIDLGEAKDIHPTNKQDVGARLAYAALNKVYRKNTEYTGPTYRNMKIDGNKAILTFDHAEKGLSVTGNSKEVTGFTIAGEDKVFYHAKAVVDGKSVIVSHDNVNKPVVVRYAWLDNPEGLNLFNKQGYPAAPFRTDKWDGLTITRRFQPGN